MSEVEKWEDWVWGEELGWILSILPILELKHIKEVLVGMKSVEDYRMFSEGHNNFLVKQIDEELMCRREGICRKTMLQERYEAAQEHWREVNEEEDKAQDRLLGSINTDEVEEVGTPKVEVKEVVKEEVKETEGEWV